MDAMDILGALLGRKSGGASGGSILRDIAASKTRTPQSSPQRQGRTPRQGNRPRSIGEAAKSLEDLLNVAEDRYANRHPSHASQASTRHEKRPRYEPPKPQDEEPLHQQAMLLIKAMIAAAKSDGQITPEEQREITGQLGHLSSAEIEFLRQEFARPSDPRAIAWDTPLGLEEHVYTVSLAAIDLDENKEAEYLADLAHGLRLTPGRCNEIHQRHGAPVIFRT